MHMAFIILGISFWTALDLFEGAPKNLKSYDIIPLLFISLTIIAGTFVSGMDAGKIYNTWPLMGLNYYPDDNTIKNLINMAAGIFQYVCDKIRTLYLVKNEFN